MVTDERRSSVSRTFSVLLIDDHVDTLTVLSKLLGSAGYSVQTATSCRDALNAARNVAFDLAICDIGLPDGNGNDLMRQLAENHGLRGIAVTGWVSSGGIAEVQSNLFEAVLPKPIDFVKIQETIRKVLHSATPSTHPTDPSAEAARSVRGTNK